MKSIMLFLALSVAFISYGVPTAFALCKEWTSANTAMEVAFQGLTAIDWKQTHDLAQYPDVNQILGKYPSRARINTYMPLAMGAHFIVSCWLTEYRRLFQGISLVLEGGVVTWNATLKYNVRF